MKDSRKPLILLADDDPLVLNVLHRQCTNWVRQLFGRDADSVRIQKFLAPSEASLASIRYSEKEFSSVMVVSDGDMPSLDGPAFIRSVSHVFRERLRSVVIYSGTLHEYAEDMRREGWKGILKPDQNHELRTLVSEYLSSLKV